MMTHKIFNRASLRAGAAPLALGMALVMAAPAFAQAAAAPAADAAPAPADQEIVVTGTIFRNASAATASPVTVLSSQDLANRGITTVSDAVQSLSANNGGTLNSNWSQFGFPKGASAPSLRGLTDGRTLTLFDGLRSAPYPLADDGYRNFVDINTIPDSIVDRVEVLQDGASSTYGADAVAGVVNVIIKKQITGLHLNASGAISQHGDDGEQRLDATYGYGDLAKDGFNVYVNGEFQNNDPLYLRDRSGPWSTANQSNICGVSQVNGAKTCASNGVLNGVQFDGSYGGIVSTTVPFVGPANADGSGILPGTQYQMLNPALGCQNLTPYTLTAAQQAARPTAPSTVCQEDRVNQYYQYGGHIQRLGGNIHLTVNVGANAQAYAMFNFYQTKTWNPYQPEAFANSTAAGGTTVTINNIILPAYVCPRGTTAACTAANGTLNPNDPFAASGQSARLLGLYDRPTEDDTRTNTFRFATGIKGSFGASNDWNYAFDATHSEAKLRYTSKNYIFAQHLLDVIADGSYNFVDQAANTDAERDYLSPTQVTNSVSKLTLIQGTLAHSFFDLPGGQLQVAVGAAWRKESIDNPSSNPANEAAPYDRYYGINAVGVEGSRTVKSAFYEIDAPVFNQLDLKATGRYDDYSSGQKQFVPKFEAQIKPVHQIKLRGTYSKGFAIPSFNEAYGLPTTGYITTQIDNSAAGQAFIAAHGHDAYATEDYSYGLTSIGNPAVKPEKSTSYTMGLVLDPVRWLTFTVDYYHITVKNLITTPDCSAAVDQYYANNGVTNVPGCVTAPGVADNNAPNALPLLGTITSFYGNANSLKTDGFDFTADIHMPITAGIRWSSNFNATYLKKLEKIDDDGVVERYDGTLGPCEITSCSGSPKLKGSWQNTLDFNNKVTFSTTINYTSGYSEVGTDDGGVYGDCAGSIGAEVRTYRDGVTPIRCHIKYFIDVDATANYKVGDKLTFYVNMLNVFNVKPRYDPAAGYGLYKFNPAWTGAGFIGRYFRVGAKVDW